MILHENRLPADDSHEISCLICYSSKSSTILYCRLLQIIGGALNFLLQILNIVKESNAANAICADCKSKGECLSDETFSCTT